MVGLHIMASTHLLLMIILHSMVLTFFRGKTKRWINLHDTTQLMGMQHRVI